MRCGARDATDCALNHAVPVLDGRCVKTRKVGRAEVPYQWAVRCPCCGAERKMTLTASHSRFLYYCHRCDASQEALAAALRDLLPECFGRPASGAKKAIGPDELVSLAARDLPITAKNVALLRLAGISAAEARRILKIPKSTYYDAMRNLAVESGFSDCAAGQT